MPFQGMVGRRLGLSANEEARARILLCPLERSRGPLGGRTDQVDAERNGK